MCLPGTVETVRRQVEEQGGPRLDRRTALVGAAGALFAGAFPAAARGAPSANRVRDLTHVNYLATDRYGLENLANLDQIPPRGATAYVGLIPWEAGSGGPCRVLATW